jgi:hypothetical protein
MPLVASVARENCASDPHHALSASEHVRVGGTGGVLSIWIVRVALARLPA